MESRFRRFLSARREKTTLQPTNTVVQHNQQSSASPQRPLATVPSPTKNKTRRGHNLDADDHGLIIQATPYGAITAGKTPVFTSGPVKGNGPIKLQSNRRLSTGEFEAATQDDKETLDDIRDGDYIIGRKLVLNSRARFVRDITRQPTPALSSTDSYESSFQSPRPAPRTPNSACSPTWSETSDYCSQQNTQSTHDGLGISSSSIPSMQSQYSHSDLIFPNPHAAPRHSQISAVTSPSVRMAGEQNATMAALWKAEHNRLVDLYGRNWIDGKVHHFNSYKSKISNPTDAWKADAKIQTTEISLDSFPSPTVESAKMTIRRSSNISSPSVYNDDNSETFSNKRVSLVSSCAGSSSYTTQTSMTDHEVVVTRDEIRKMINEMRSTYLRALDTQPLSQSKPSLTVRRKRRSKLGPSVKRNSVKPMMSADRQTWHANHQPRSDNSYGDGLKLRAASQPVAAFGKLSPSEPCPMPRREKRPSDRLQRADSATLGTMLAKIKSEDRDSDHSSTAKPFPTQSQSETVTPAVCLAHNTPAGATSTRDCQHLGSCTNDQSLQTPSVQLESNFF